MLLQQQRVRSGCRGEPLRRTTIGNQPPPETGLRGLGKGLPYFGGEAGSPEWGWRGERSSPPGGAPERPLGSGCGDGMVKGAGGGRADLPGRTLPFLPQEPAGPHSSADPAFPPGKGAPDPPPTAIHLAMARSLGFGSKVWNPPPAPPRGGGGPRFRCAYPMGLDCGAPEGTGMLFRRRFRPPDLLFPPAGGEGLWDGAAFETARRPPPPFPDRERHRRPTGEVFLLPGWPMGCPQGCPVPNL